MPREATGSVTYQPGNSTTPGHYKVRLTLADGQRHWYHFPPSEQSANAEAEFRKRAAELSEKVRDAGLTKADLKRKVDVRKVPTTAETVAEYFERWAADRKAKGIASPHNDQSRFRTHVEPVLGHRPMTKVRAEHLQDFVEGIDHKIRAGTYSWQTGRQAWALVSKMFRDAKHSKVRALRVLANNPAQDVAPPDRGAMKVKQWLFPTELAKLLACEAVPLCWRELYACAAYLYLRPGELAALEWRHVDLAHGFVSVAQAVDLKTGEVRHPKTKGGRKVPIPLALRPLLQVMGERHGWEGRVIREIEIIGRKEGSRRPRKSEHKRVAADAAHGLPEQLAHPVRLHLTDAKVTRAELHEDTPTSKRITFYDLRATGITWLALDGVAPMTMMQRAGHSNIDTTMGYVRAAEVVGADVGEPFAALPKALAPAESSDDTKGAGTNHRIISSKSAESGHARRDSNSRHSDPKSDALSS